jgi:dTDP-4-dehydrorhamnose reductase
MLTKICILGGSGLIGSTILSKNYPVEKISYTYRKNIINIKSNRLQLDIPRDFKKLKEFITIEEPDYIINTISNSNPNYCEINQEETLDVNVEFIKKIFELTKNRGIKLIQFSTDYVFNGNKGKYIETDTPEPINYYGYSKYLSEKIVLQNSLNTVIRTSLVYGKNQNSKFFNFIFNNLKKEKEIDVYDDIFFSPTLVDDISTAVYKIIEKSLNGIFHVSGPDCISKYEFAQKIADVFDFDKTLIHPLSINKIKSNVKYPSKTCLDSSITSAKINQEFYSIEKSLKYMKNLMKK